MYTRPLHLLSLDFALSASCVHIGKLRKILSKDSKAAISNRSKHAKEEACSMWKVLAIDNYMLVGLIIMIFFPAPIFYHFQ